jgi:lipoprotein-releasing system permease protein
MNYHLIMLKGGGMVDSEELLRTVQEVPGVVAATPFLEGQVLLKKDEQIRGVLLRGVEPESELRASDLDKYLKNPGLNFNPGKKGISGIIVGTELARQLDLSLGDPVSIISPMDGKIYKFAVANIFDSGMYEYDLNLVFIALQEAQGVFRAPGKITAVGITIRDASRAPAVKEELKQRFGYNLWVRTWMEMRRSFFSALKLEKTVMFVILSLIVLVACFNISGTLIMAVMEKTKEVGILKALGAKNSSLGLIFSLQGLIIGIVGTALGAAGGGIICYILKNSELIRLPAAVSKIYFGMTRLPVQLQWSDFTIIVIGAILISFVATIYPALRAARLNPVEAIRYE